MSSNKEFTEQELKEMGARTLDLIFEAIDAGDKEKAKELSQRMYDESLFLHDAYGVWVTSLMSYTYRHYGSQALEASEREAHTIEMKTVMKPPAKKDFRSKVEHLASGLRGHMQPIKIEEDDEKVCLSMRPCGSGQRLCQRGVYEPPINLAKVKEPLPITWGKENLPIYCVHSPIMEILSIERAGYPATVHYPAEKIGEGYCRYCVYKDPQTIPEEVYTKVGKKKPSGVSK